MKTQNTFEKTTVPRLVMSIYAEVIHEPFTVFVDNFLKMIVVVVFRGHKYNKDNLVFFNRVVVVEFIFAEHLVTFVFTFLF